MNTLPLDHLLKNVTVVIISDNARSPSESVTFRRKRTRAHKTKSWDRFGESVNNTQRCPPRVTSPLMKTAGQEEDSPVLRKPVRRSSDECENIPCPSSPRKPVRRTSVETPVDTCAPVKKSYPQVAPKKPIRKMSVDCIGPALADICAQVTAAMEGPSKPIRRQSRDSLDDGDVDETNRKANIRRSASNEDNSRSSLTLVGDPAKRRRASIESFVSTQ